jgi:hypothetical protein
MLIKLYKKKILVKYTFNIIYKLLLLYNKNLFVIYNDIYRHKVWDYKNVAKRK